MSRTRHKLSRKIGQPPGTLVQDDLSTGPVRITIIDYDGQHFEERVVKQIAECSPFRETDTVTWINIDGLSNARVIEDLGACYRIHPVVLEDLQNIEQRPKFQELENYLYMGLKMLQQKPEGGIKIEHVSLIIGENYVLSFQQDIGDVFDPVRDRIRKDGRIRKFGPDYLAYSLIDVIVDNYFLVLEKLEEEVEILEEDIVEKTSPETLERIRALKKDMIFLRKSVWPLREVILGLDRSESGLVRDTTKPYLRDVYDHTIQVIDTLEVFRDMISGMTEIYVSSLSYRMNEIMKVLTMIATIFIPLTFIVGIYGMNFEFMPELSHEYGYPGVWAAMIGVVVVMLLYFRKRGWL
ncbi:MAG: magnesium/cobalt transporter CorA [Methanoregulaceae archaeon]|nr:magnesium/cobalt transporter CorA [Methanoregulaceae archaeon]